jgi:hypothetical protein
MKRPTRTPWSGPYYRIEHKGKIIVPLYPKYMADEFLRCFNRSRTGPDKAHMVKLTELPK